MNSDKKPVKPGDIISSLERGLNVISCFDEEFVEMTPADVAARTNLPRAATRRVLLTLEQLGYAVSDGKRFRLTPRILDLSHGYLANVRVSELIEPILVEAKDKTQESCALMIRAGKEMVCIMSSNPSSFGYVPFDIGIRIPVHESSAGRVFMAAMQEKELSDYLTSVKLVKRTPKSIVKKTEMRKAIELIREQGYAFTKDEYSLGIFGMAVPVTKNGDRVIASVTCLGNSARVNTDAEVNKILSVISEAAHRISVLLPEDFDFSSDRTDT